MLNVLNLGRNKIGDDEAILLAKNTTLTTLNLDTNAIRERGLVALARNTTLTTLNLSFNHVGDVGAVALSRNTTLTTLTLTGNRIGDIGAVELARNSTLRTLLLTTNQIGEYGAVALAVNTTLMELHLGSNPIGDNGVIALAGNATLATLSITPEDFGERALAALTRNTTLTDVGELRAFRYRHHAGVQQINEQIKRNCETSCSLQDACYFETSPYKSVISLLEAGVLPYGSYMQNKLDYRDTLLHLAVRERQPALVDLLLAHGAAADRNTKNSDGVTYRELANVMGVRLSSAYFGSMCPLY